MAKDQEQERGPVGTFKCQVCGQVLDADLMVKADVSDVCATPVCFPCYQVAFKETVRKAHDAAIQERGQVPDQEQEDYPNRGPFFGNSFAGLGNGPAGDGEDGEQPASAPVRCVQGCYMVQHDNALESGGPGWYPLHWLEGAWRAYFSLGYFEIITLRFPTRQEALDYVYNQP